MLKKNLHDWTEWSNSADKSEEGWESDFPGWKRLLVSSVDCMANSTCFWNHRDDIEKVWVISEESEAMIYECKKKYSKIKSSLYMLSYSRSEIVRWQVYSTFLKYDEVATGVLLRAVGDSDTYARRRALLALAGRNVDHATLAREAVRDSDPYIRQSAAVLAMGSLDSDLVREIRSILILDHVEHVASAGNSMVVEGL